MPRRAVIVSPAPNTRVGGVERYCSQVGELLVARGWEVTEIGPAGDGPGRLAGRLGAGPLLASRAATARIAALSPDLVVSNGLLGAGAPRAIPRIHIYHGTMVLHTWRGDVGASRLTRARNIAALGLAERAAGAGAVNIATTASVAREVRRFYRRRIDRIIPLTVDTERFAPRDRGEARARLGLDAGARIALFVGSLEPRKGSDLLAEVCARAGFELAVTRPAGPDGAHALGTLSDDELPWAYAAADALLFPSRYEGFGYVTLEALACGTPVVTTSTGWATTLVARVPGYAPFVVAPEAGALAAALRSVDGSPRVADLVREARAVVLAEHNLGVWREAWAELLDAVAG